jgi:hypothetical protein
MTLFFFFVVDVSCQLYMRNRYSSPTLQAASCKDLPETCTAFYTTQANALEVT